MEVPDIKINDKIALTAVAILGKDYAEAAFRLVRDIKTPKQHSVDVMVSRWLNKPQHQDFLEAVKRGYANVLTGNIGEGDELSDGQLTSIISKGILSESDAKKRSDVALKLLSYRQSQAREDEEEREPRAYFLPWISHCRTCALMLAYQKVCKAHDELEDKTT